MRITLQHSESD